MARIRVIEQDEASGRLLEIYNDLIKKRGKLANVHKIQSLHPESIVKHMELYIEIMFSKSELSRADREMMALVVSIANGCEYCQLHHAEALNHYWKDEVRINRLHSGYSASNLNSKQIALCEYAENLTNNPIGFNETAFMDHLKETGLSDSAILDATLVIAYFNFVNRIVLALGVETSENEIKGYHF